MGRGRKYPARKGNCTTQWLIAPVPSPWLWRRRQCDLNARRDVGTATTGKGDRTRNSVTLSRSPVMGFGPISAPLSPSVVMGFGPGPKAL